MNILKPTTGYALVHKTNKTLPPAFIIYLGIGDNANNYDEITEEEYAKIILQQINKIMAGE